MPRKKKIKVVGPEVPFEQFEPKEMLKRFVASVFNKDFKFNSANQGSAHYG